MTETTQQFNYSPSVVRVIFGLLFVTALPFGLANIAKENQKGLRFFHLFTLSPTEASLFYWGVAIMCGVAALLVFIATFNSLRGAKIVELTATHAVVPKASIRGGQLNIPYESIKEIKRRKISARQEMIVIKSTIGEARLISSNFRGLLSFDDFLATLNERMTRLGAR